MKNLSKKKKIIIGGLLLAACCLLLAWQVMDVKSKSEEKAMAKPFSRDSLMISPG